MIHISNPLAHADWRPALDLLEEQFRPESNALQFVVNHWIFVRGAGQPSCHLFLKATEDRDVEWLLDQQRRINEGKSA